MDTTTLTYVANTTEDIQNHLRIRQNQPDEDSTKDDPSGLAVSGDTVSISEQGKRLSGQAVQKIEESDEADTEQSLTERRIENLEKRIEEIQQEIQEVQTDNKLDDKEKQQKVQALTSELLQAEQELSELQSQSGTTGGGTPAEGFANSLT